jgi:hypothetical protein
MEVAVDGELLRAIATYASVLAVVISIASLASQVRRHTRSLQSQNYAKVLDRIAAIQSRLGTDANASGTFSRGVRDPAALTPDERIQFAWILYEIFGGFEFMYEEAQRDALPPDVWKRWSETMAWWLSLPGVRAWWKSKPAPFTRGFSSLVERQLAEPAHDPAAAERWQVFLAQEER